MLAATYRFSVYNNIGAAQASLASGSVILEGKLWKFNSSGALTHSSETTFFDITAGTWNNQTYQNGTTIDNTSDLYLGGHFNFRAEPDGSAGTTNRTGSFDVFLEFSEDGGTTWTLDGEGTPMCSLSWSASHEQKSAQFEL